MRLAFGADANDPELNTVNPFLDKLKKYGFNFLILNAYAYDTVGPRVTRATMISVHRPCTRGKARTTNQSRIVSTWHTGNIMTACSRHFTARDHGAHLDQGL